MPRILVFFPFCFSAAAQGNEKRTLNFVQLLLEWGHEVDILSYEGMAGQFWDKNLGIENVSSIELVKVGGLLKRAVRRLMRLLGRPVWGPSQMDFELRRLSRVDEIASTNNAYEYPPSYSKRSAEVPMKRLFKCIVKN
jgi:hypothetical protein